MNVSCRCSCATVFWEWSRPFSEYYFANNDGPSRFKAGGSTVER